jgi:5-methyltetrahydropteroyltriglutamate--homocysteine methyltransferase
LLDECIEMDNAIIAGHGGMTFGLHICRGNNQSKYYAEGGYGPIARLSRTRFDRYLVEYDDERSGDFEPLREVPENRVVVLGLVTTKRPRLEDKDFLKRRIADAARIIPLERLALSPQCGFASTMEGNKLTQDEQRAKLGLVGRVARSVFG